MNIDQIIFSMPISVIWKALGGDAPRRGRARAFYRGGDNPDAISLNDEKGCWYDHRDHVGGGILDLIQSLLSCSRAAALRWLSDFTGIPLETPPFSAAERRQYVRSLAQAEELARDVADFERGLELFLLRRVEYFAALTQWLLSLGGEPGELLMSAVRDVGMLRNADPHSLVAAYRELPESVRGRFRDEGHCDREHAERVTLAIVDLLARAQSEAAA